jgi:predicted Zn-dependent peptidase
MVQAGALVVAVVGDVPQPPVVEALARLPLAAAPRRPALPEVKFEGRHVTLRRDGQEQAHVRLVFDAPAAGDRRVPALLVLNRLLGDGASSRLFQRVREDAGLTYDIWSGPILRQPAGLLEVGWACSPERFAESWQLVVEELDRAARDIGADEIEVAREGLLRTLQMDLESPSGWCALDVGEFIDRDRRFDPDRACGEIRSVTLDDVRQLAAEVLQPENRASAVCGPEGVASRVA